MSNLTTRVEFAEKFAPLFRPHRYKVFHGGRGAGKSWAVARALLVLAASRQLRILCGRELQNSIKDSVHKLLCDQIEAIGYEDHFRTTDNAIRCSNGSEFIFSGIRHNVKKIKSMEGVDIVWLEEAETVSENSWRILIPTIRKAGSEIWVTFNPDQDSDPTYKRFITNPPPSAVVTKVNWYDNPWFPDELRIEKDHDYSVDPDAADHVWGGKTNKRSNVQILFGKWVVEPFDVGDGFDGPYQGADWGFAQDPTTLVRLWIREFERDGKTFRDLYIEREAYKVGVDVVDTPELFDTVPGAKNYVTRADNARPETISHMKQHHYPRVIAAEKGPGSVEDGIMHLRGFNKIIIHPRCVHAAQEARLWKWKTDRLTGDILPVPEKKHDHIMDAARYALEPIMKRRKKSYDDYKSAGKRRAATPATKTAHRPGGGFKARTGGIL